MGTKYSSNTAAGYNATPPSDDGTVNESNKVKWSTIKTKLADPPKDLADTINSELVTHFDNGPTALITNTTIGLTHFNQVIEVSGSAVTLTLSDAASLAAGWYCWIKVTGTADVTLARATGADTLDGAAANQTLRPTSHTFIVVNAAADGFLMIGAGLNQHANRQSWAKGADIASTAALPIGTDGNYFDITGTIPITSLSDVAIGTVIKLHFDGVLILTHHATDLILPGGANIDTAAGDEAELVQYAAGDWRCTAYTKASGASLWAPKGYLYGLTLSNNSTDANKDIDFASGDCTDTTGAYLMSLGSTFVKQLDAAWAVGTAAGGLFTGSVAADTTYHCFLIRKDSDGSIDTGFDTSVTAANIPTGYTAYRRVGSIITNSSSNILGFFQTGNEFLLKAVISDWSGAGHTTAYSHTLTVPGGVQFLAMIQGGIHDASPSGLSIYTLFTSLDQTNIGVSASIHTVRGNTSTSVQQSSSYQTLVRTSTGSQIRERSSETGFTLSVQTVGWIDTRGRD